MWFEPIKIHMDIHHEMYTHLEMMKAEYMEARNCIVKILKGFN